MPVGGTPVVARKRLLTLSLAGGAIPLAGTLAVYSCQSCEPALPPETPVPPVPSASPPSGGAGGAVSVGGAGGTAGTGAGTGGAPERGCDFRRPGEGRALRTDLAPRIVGGEPALPGEFPFAASLQRGGSHFCGGSVFRDKWIVTAAHCQVYERYEVVVGREDLRTSGGEVHQVGWSTIKVHPSYDEPIRFDFDVALIELPGPAGVPSVALLGNVWETAGEATTIGWGRTFEGGPASPILLKVRVPLVSDATCRQHYPGLTPQMLCADTVGLGSCQGDSGGALLFGGQLAGIVSYGRGCAGEAPGVYAQIQSEVGDWIDRCAR